MIQSNDKLSASCSNCKHHGRRATDHAREEGYEAFSRCLLPEPKMTTKRVRSKPPIKTACSSFVFPTVSGYSGQARAYLHTGPDYFCIHWEART
jgi:hypothetical protein